MGGGEPGRIAALVIYPIKGAAGIEVEATTLGPQGLAHDRRWMIVEPTGRFLTQRELPELALVRALPTAAGLDLRLGEDEHAVRLPPRPLRLTVTVWGDEVEALVAPEDVNGPLSAFLGRPVKLVRFPDDAMRACDPDYAPSGSHTGFADGFPVLVTSTASLDELNAELARAGEPPVPMTRFRPNIVVEDTMPGAEDRYGRLIVESGIRIVLVKRCDRCVVTTVDQTTGRKTGKEPLRTLARLRRNIRTGGAWFGQNGVPVLQDDAASDIAVGMSCRFA